jgi:hypothetical protein
LEACCWLELPIKIRIAEIEKGTIERTIKLPRKTVYVYFISGLSVVIEVNVKRINTPAIAVAST